MKQRRFDLVLSSVKHAFHQGHAVLRNNFQFPITHISLTRALRRHGGSSSIHRYHRYKAVAGENHLMDNNSVFNGYGNYNRTFSSYSSASQRDVRYRFHSLNPQLCLIQLFHSLIFKVFFCYGLWLRGFCVFSIITRMFFFFVYFNTHDTIHCQF